MKRWPWGAICTALLVGATGVTIVGPVVCSPSATVMAWNAFRAGTQMKKLQLPKGSSDNVVIPNIAGWKLVPGEGWQAQPRRH